MRFNDVSCVLLVLASLAGGCRKTPVQSNTAEAAYTGAQRLVRDNTAFALDLYEHLRARPGNLFFSPHSVSTALGMTYAGARESTATEMARALHFSLGPEQLHLAFAELQAGLNQVQEAGNVELRVANSLWPQQGYPFLPEYLSLIETHYGGSVTPVDFSTEAARETTRQTINRWVESRTRERIKELIRPGCLHERMRLVLTNAIYFKGKWKNEFYPWSTRDIAFHLSAAKSVPVPMMYQKKYFRYGGDSSLQILEMPYRGGELSMLILLPAKIEGLRRLEKKLSVENLSRWRGLLKETEVDVIVPKFEMVWDADLKAVLQGMGMAKPFASGGANFAGLDGNPNWFYLAGVIHKAYVGMNEEGTEAAAATGVEAVAFSSMDRSPQPPEFRADHPFVFLIQDNRTGSVLFLGRVVDPTDSSLG